MFILRTNETHLKGLTGHGGEQPQEGAQMLLNPTLKTHKAATINIREIHQRTYQFYKQLPLQIHISYHEIFLASNNLNNSRPSLEMYFISHVACLV